MVFTDYGDMGLGSLQAGVGSFLDAMKQRTAQQQLEALGTAISSGDYAGAASAALKSGNLNAGLSLLKLDQQQKAMNAPSDPAVATALNFGGDPSTATANVPAGKPAPVGGFNNANSRTMSFEVDPDNPDKVAIDNNGAPVKYGINQAAHPDINVASLNPDQAKSIYKKNYWDALGLDNVEPRLAHVIYDTAVNSGPEKAQEIMDQSGGDANKALGLRTAYLNRLIATGDPKYADPGVVNSWRARLASLKADINAPGGGQLASADNAGPTPDTTAAPGGRVMASDEDNTDVAGGKNAAQIAQMRGQRNWILSQAERLGKQEALNPAAKTSKEILLKKYDDLGEQIKGLKDKSPDIREFTDQDYARFRLDPQMDGKYYYADGKPTGIGARRTGADWAKVVPQGATVIGPDPDNPGRTKILYGGQPKEVDPEIVRGMTDRIVAGDTTVLTGLGRNKENAPLVKAVTEELGRRAAADPTLKDQIIQNRAHVAGTTAGARTSGQIMARVNQYIGEADNAMNIAQQTSSQLPRTSYTTPNRLLQMAQGEVNDPTLAAHKAAINSVVNTYAKAMNPTGQPTETSRNHAREILGPAQSPEAFGAALNVLRMEMAGSRHTAQNIWGGGEPPTEGETTPLGAPTPATGQSRGFTDIVGGMLGMGQNNPPPTSFKPIDLGGGVTMRQVR